MSVNPFKVARAFLEIVRLELDALENNEEPNEVEKQIASILFEKFGEISMEHQVVEEFVNEFAEEGLSYQDSSGTSQSQGPSSQSQDFTKQQKPKREYVSIKQKAKILKIMKDRNLKPQSVRRLYPSFKDKSYKARWAKQVQNGESEWEIMEEIRMFTLKRFREARSEYKPVHDRDLRRWAMQRATDFPSIRKTFSASVQWIQTFKRKHKIKSRKITNLIGKREMASQEDILNAAEAFRQTIQELQPSYELSEIWNTDQIGFTYEYLSNRTLTNVGERFVFGSAFSPKNRMTHSYTMQYIISADGSIVGKPFLCLQEPGGRIGDTVKDKMMKVPNLEITCSVSGKLTSTHVSYFVDKVIRPVVKKRLLYILDSWTGHINDKIYSEAIALEDVEFLLKIIPKHCPGLVQPLDVYFNLQLKFIVKKIYDHANILDRRITSRDDIIKIQSLAHFIISAPIFRGMIQYCFVKAGLIEIEREYFDSVRDICFSFKSAVCEIENCVNEAFIKCSRCETVLCFHDFYDEYHVTKCDQSPYLEATEID